MYLLDIEDVYSITVNNVKQALLLIVAVSCIILYLCKELYIFKFGIVGTFIVNLAVLIYYLLTVNKDNWYEDNVYCESSTFLSVKFYPNYIYLNFSGKYIKSNPNSLYRVISILNLVVYFEQKGS